MKELTFKSKKNIIHSIIASFIFIFLIFVPFLKKDVNESKLKEFYTTVQSKPEIQRIGKQYGITFMVEYCKYPIKITQPTYYAIDNNQFIEDINIGDQIILTIEKSDYIDFTLNNEKRKWHQGEYIYTYGVRTKSKTYVDIDSYNEYSKKDYLIATFFGTAGLILILLSFFKQEPLKLVLKKSALIMCITGVLFILIYKTIFL